MTLLKRFSFIFWLAGAMLLSALFAFKPLSKNQDEFSDIQEGIYVVAKSRFGDSEQQFSVRDRLVFRDIGNSPDLRLNITNKALTIGLDGRPGRCNHCHECGFDLAWDMANYGTDTWNPVYTGEEWRPIVARMRKKENAYVNEEIADRIFSFLRDETLGVYDEVSDSKGAIKIDRPAPTAIQREQ